MLYSWTYAFHSPWLCLQTWIGVRTYMAAECLRTAVLRLACIACYNTLHVNIYPVLATLGAVLMPASSALYAPHEKALKS